MGSRSVCFNFTPGENEQIETVIVIPEEHRSIIHGIIKDHCNKVVKDAVVILYESISCHGDHDLKPLTHTFTDDCGQFVFGPLCSSRNYVIKVWVNDVKIRDLVIKPEDCKCSKYHHNGDEAKGTEVEETEVEETKEIDEEPYNYGPFEEFDRIIKHNLEMRIQSEAEQSSIPDTSFDETEQNENLDKLDE
ncbi:MAG: hypothetical protein K0R34_2228 [Herbinix sp.]|jgi:hypothetical protein|nr:hypothetical protein [Herbinix sp.]